MKRIRSRRRAGGQAMVEYAIVLSTFVLALTTAVPEVRTGFCEGAAQCPIFEQAMNVIRSNYQGYSYAVSWSDYPDKDNPISYENFLQGQGVSAERRVYLASYPDGLFETIKNYATNAFPVLGDIDDALAPLYSEFDPFDPTTYVNLI